MEEFPAPLHPYLQSAYRSIMLNELALALTDWAFRDFENMKLLVQAALSDDIRASHRCSRVLKFVAERDISGLVPFFDQMIERYPHLPHSGSRREIMRIFAENVPEFPADLEGILVETAINSLDDPNEAIAVRVHAMRVAERMCKKYPELADEVISIIQKHLPDGSTGFQNRGKKTIRRLSRLANS